MVVRDNKDFTGEMTKTDKVARNGGNRNHWSANKVLMARTHQNPGMRASPVKLTGLLQGKIENYKKER